MARRPARNDRTYDSRTSVCDAFDAARHLDPQAPALLGTSQRMSYDEMAERVDQVAEALRQGGVGPGDHVALYGTRGLPSIIAIFAILRSGAIFVPLEPNFAPEQLSFIASDVPFRAALCAREHVEVARALFGSTSVPVLVAEDCTVSPGLADWPQVSGESPACILYTSGTTGEPKGVVVPHRAITAMALAQPEVAMGPGDVSLAAATIACDGALYEILVPLMSGAAVAVVEAATPGVQDVAETMIRHQVTVAAWYAGLHHLVIDHRIDAFASVRLSLPGGDVMSAPMAEKLMRAWPDLRLVNAYGPTETCVRSFTHEVTLEDTRSGAVPIGRPMTGETAVLLDDELREVPDGTTGQIAIGGLGLALGYYNRPEKSTTAFIPDPREGHDGTLYLTGDLGRMRADGAFEFLGRADRQVKLAGRRVEIDGVEHILRGLSGLRDVAVELVKEGGKPSHLVAFVVPDDPSVSETELISALRQTSTDQLPRDVFPRRVILRDALPLTQAGKVDRKALRSSLEAAALTGSVARRTHDTSTSNTVQSQLATIWQAVLGGAVPTADQTFFDLGGTSLQLIDTHARIERALNLRFDLTVMFDTPRLGDLAKRLAALESAQFDPSAKAPATPTRVAATDTAIAIVGRAARLPGEVTLDTFWEVIREGRNVITRFDPALAEDTFDPATRAGATYVPARSILRDVDQFDAKFFGMRKREAALTDPQGRIFLEICHEALEDAGIDPQRAPGPIGLFAGGSMSTYMLENLLASRQEQRDFTTGFQINYDILAGNDVGALATRVAYRLGLKGPALSISTACSTSLVAIAQAVRALRAGEADVMLAGGVSITFPQIRGYLHQEGGMASGDGTCRPFDAAADGTVFGHGAGVVVLKRLSDALAAGDQIHAVIRGVGTNNDGADKMSFTAPSVAGQADAIRAAHRDARITPDQVSYVECHGTATPLGDPIEIAGLTQVFAGSGTRCALGSVKGNLGHLDAAAGVVSVIKLMETLRRREIPPVAHFTTLNPRIGLDDTPFWVPDQSSDWTSDGPRLAGVSSFGVGGTNAHLVLEEAPVRESQLIATGTSYLPLSAKSPEALMQMAGELADRLDSGDALDLPDVAWTLQEGRQTFPWRHAIAATDRATAIKDLRNVTSPKAPAEEAPKVVFLFPGQGAQYPGMGAGLYETDATYAHWIDEGATYLIDRLGRDLRPLILGRDLSEAEAAAALRETAITQPALFLTEFALAKLWQSRGLEPELSIGHSVGEFAAAALSGVMSFEDALDLIAIRGRLMQDQPGGAMLSVRATMETLAEHLTPDLAPGCDLAARNAPKMQVVSGPFEAIEQLESRLTAAGVACKRLHTSHAFHSAMMDPVADDLSKAADRITFHAPTRPIISTVTGAIFTDAEAREPSYWAAQARACVNFQAALDAATGTRLPVFVEVGPGRTLSAFTAQTLDRSRHRGVFQSLPDHARSVSDRDMVSAAAASLWGAGVDLDWARQGPRGLRKVSLPTYPFQRQKCWIDPPETADHREVAQGTEAHTPQAARPQETPAMAIISSAPVSTTHSDRPARLCSELTALLADMSGEDIGVAQVDDSFLELGFDSLFLGQVSQAIARRYKVDIGFRQLLADVSSVRRLADHLDGAMPADAEVAPAQVPVADAGPMVAPLAGPAPVTSAPAPGLESILQAQMQTMQAVFAQQLHALGGSGAIAPATVATPAMAQPFGAQPSDAHPGAQQPAAADRSATTEDSADDKPTPRPGFGPYAVSGTLDARQLAFVRDLAEKYSARHRKSKDHATQFRDVHADPRTAAGFRAEWKELTFPIVAEIAKGAYIHDIDGNRFVDLVNGFGQTAFGHSPDFVNRAIEAQLKRGMPIGPQSDLAGPVARRFADLVGHERATFCSTGSEAVMAAMRVARTVTGRDLIVVFDKDYHGQFDEVLVKGRSTPGDATALPSAPGIPRSGLVNMKVLPYGQAGSLDWIRANIDDIAGVIVEPVQSRHPAHRPESFVRELREVTQDGGAALVMDEIVTGFRTHARGMQGVWGIQGDMATYGKVVGGGMPVGILAGNARFMDALDGGPWSYGDDSRPEAIPTFFAGTFVRHPLAVAAVDAMLTHIEEQGDTLWNDTAARTAETVGRMNAILTARGLPELVETYSSWFVIKVTEADPRAALLFSLMRMEGVHVMDGFCGFLTTEHGAAECEQIVAAFETAVDALLTVGILMDARSDATAASVVADAPHAASATLTDGQQIPLTESQREIWMNHQLSDAHAIALIESGSLTLDGELDAGALQSAWDAVIARHDALRLRFARSGTHFEVRAAQPDPLSHIDLSGEDDPQAALDRVIAEDARQPFDITADLPIRARLAQLAPTRHVLVLYADHIVADGWSFGVILSDLAKLYTAALTGTPAALPPAPSFAEHAQQEAARRGDTRIDDYWADLYAEVPGVVDLPADHPRPERRSLRGGTVFHSIDGELSKAVRKSGAKHGCTMFAATLAAMQLLVHRLTGERDIVLGVPCAGQQGLPDPALVGHCVNFLPIRAPIAEGASVADHLGVAGQRFFDALGHSDTTLGSILADLNLPRQIDSLPLTSIEFNLEKSAEAAGMAGLETEFRKNAKVAVTFDLVFNVVDTGEGFLIEAHYNADLYDPETVRDWARAYEQVLTAIANAPEQNASAIPLSANDVALDQIDANELDYDRSATLATLIEASIADNPDAIAIEDSEGPATYADLGAEADAVAALIQRKVPQPGSRIALCLPRDRKLAAGMLAILKAGHAYVPLDPRQPAARLAQICQTAEVAGILTDSAETAGFAADLDVPLILTPEAKSGDAPEATATDPEDTAYIIFTSGTTGTPKGVAVPHRAVVNFLTSMAIEPGFTAKDRLLAVTTVMFDIAVLEVFLPLMTGARLFIAETDEVIDGFRLVDRLNKGEITVMQATPTLWDMVLSAGFAPKAGFRILCGGEPLPADLAARLTADGAEVWNMYGPSETTVWSTLKRITPDAPITVGRAIGNTTLHILDDAGRHVAPGKVGELNIGGDGLALGYYNRPDLTEKVFREVDQAGGAQRLYATGDLARRLPDGEIEVLGRIDTQVKLRGFRIELGEIETALRAIPGVAKAAVDLRARGKTDRQLVGFVVPEDGSAPDPSALSATLASTLPDYMIPRAWVTLSTFPQTGSGKLDRKALPDPDEKASVTPLRQVIAPESDTERRIAAIWADVMGVESLSVTETLFSLGIDSLAVFRIAAKMLEDGLELEARHMFAHPSVRELAAFHDSRATPEGGTAGARPSLKNFRNGARRTRGGGTN